MSEHPPLIVPRRFCGPPSSGNGGWTAGALAALVDHDCPENRADAWPAITVALRQPPPLDTPMSRRRRRPPSDGAETVASFGGAVVARARLADADPALVEPVPADEARAAMASYPGLVSHPFPTCLVCGTDREEGDGLRIFPGRVGRPGRRHPDRGRPGRRTRAPARTTTPTSTSCPAPRSPRPGRRWTASAAGPAT